jgi:hypothetical protein
MPISIISPVGDCFNGGEYKESASIIQTGQPGRKQKLFRLKPALLSGRLWKAVGWIAGFMGN